MTTMDISSIFHKNRVVKYSRYLLYALVVIAIVLLVYATIIEPYRLEINRYTVRVFEGTDPSVKMRVALVSDLHLCPQTGIFDICPQASIDFYERVLGELNKIDADYIVIAGDTIDNKKEMHMRDLLLGIENKNRTIFVLGTHEYNVRPANRAVADEFSGWLKRNGFIVLRNENLVYTKGNTTACFVGLDSLWAGAADPKKAYQGLDPECVTILISHEPDSILMLDKERSDLALAGHTHGGQVCLHVVGAPVAGFVSKFTENCARGFFEVNGRKLFITKGVGSLYSIRFNSAPEIVIFDLI